MLVACIGEIISVNSLEVQFYLSVVKGHMITNVFNNA